MKKNDKIIINRQTLWASFGAGFEYYDFIIYGMLAGYLSQLFFVASDPFVALLQTFSVFFLGYLARPFGGLLFGLIGDRYGRKKTFLAVMLLMGSASLVIGLLPVYEQAGALSSAMLIVCRILQGISYGAEMPNAMIVSCESSEQKQRAGQSSFVISSVALGSMLASYVSYLLATYFQEAEILSWAWRLPFILGAFLVMISYFLRRKLHETEEFTSYAKQQKGQQFKENIIAPLSKLFASHKSIIFSSMGMLLVMGVIHLSVLYFPTLMSMHYGYEKSQVYYAITLSLVWSAITLPLMGKLSDKIGHMTLLRVGIFVYIITIPLLFTLLNEARIGRLILFMVIYQTYVSIIFVNYFPIFVSRFRVSVRFTAIALIYNVVYSVSGATPLVLTSLYQMGHGQVDYLIYFYVFSGLLSLAFTFVCCKNAT